MGGDYLKKGKCALCGLKRELQMSHIIPKFIYKKMREHNQSLNLSKEFRMRNSNNPNRVIQDGYKVYLLCRECEQKFSIREKSFKEKQFKYFEEGLLTDEINLKDDNFSFFVISLFWRLLHLEIEDIRKTHRYRDSPKDLKILKNTESDMKKYLNGKIDQNWPFALLFDLYKSSDPIRGTFSWFVDLPKYHFIIQYVDLLGFRIFQIIPNSKYPLAIDDQGKYVRHVFEEDIEKEEIISIATDFQVATLESTIKKVKNNEKTKIVKNSQL